jgi:hypothetical protein
MKYGHALGGNAVSTATREECLRPLVAAATGVELFSRENVTAISSAPSALAWSEGPTGHHDFLRLVVMSDNLIHVFQRSANVAKMGCSR